MQNLEHKIVVFETMINLKKIQEGGSKDMEIWDETQ